jgi:hypothetical protein
MTALVEKSGADGAGTEKKKAFHPHRKKPTDEQKVVAKLSILKFGKGSNFHKFRVALTKVALEEYGDLRKLIKKESYYVPQFMLPTYARWA